MTECPRCRIRYGGSERFCSHDGEKLMPIPELLCMLGPEALLDRTVDRRYHVLETIGRGGMGTVYKAEHIKLRIHVALKVLHPHLALRPVVLARFEREARAASQIGHPNIVQVFDMGEISDTGAPYFAMECLIGESLKDVFVRQRWFHINQILPLTRQICAALLAAHDAGIVHRDLKPANVFLVGDSPRHAVAKLLDFGVSKLVERDPENPTLTGTGVILGTPGYMAPEQADGRPVDARSDIYSLGVILYRALSGTVPFKAANMVLLLQRIVEEPPLPPSLRAPDREIPHLLEDVVLHALQKDPAKRPQTSEELLHELEEAMSGIVGDEHSTSIDLVPYGMMEGGERTVRPRRGRRTVAGRPAAARRSTVPEMPQPSFGSRIATDHETKTETETETETALSIDRRLSKDDAVDAGPLPEIDDEKTTRPSGSALAPIPEEEEP